MNKKVLINKIRCKECDDIIESKHEHDFQRCQCGMIFLDGGTNYQRFGCREGDPEDYIDFSFSKYE